MLGMGWTELMVIGVVGLIVIGPKDLPDMFRTLGRFTSKARRMAGDFQRAIESVADDTGVKDVAKDLNTMTSARSMGLEAVKGAVSKFEAWDPMKPQAKAAPRATPVAEPAVAVVNGAGAVGPAPNGTALDVAALTGSVTAATVPAYGPATQALADTQAARRIILSDASAALKAVDAGPAVVAPVPTSKAPGRRRAVAPAAVLPVELLEGLPKKPRAPRKSAAKVEPE